MIRRIDDLGRVVIPREIRQRLHIDEGDELDLNVIGDTIAITKHKHTCVYCGRKVIFDYEPRPLCDKCLDKLEDDNKLAEALELALENYDHWVDGKLETMTRCMDVLARYKEGSR